MIIGKTRSIIKWICRHYGDYIIKIITCRVLSHVKASITCGSYKKYPRVPGGCNGIILCLVIKQTTERGVYTIDTPGSGITNGFNNICRVSLAIRIESPQGHQSNRPTNTGDTLPIVTYCANDSSYMSAVIILIRWVGVIIHKIVSPNIIVIAIAVIIDIVKIDRRIHNTRLVDFSIIYPNIVKQVRMININTAINNRNNHLRIAC